MKIMIIINDDCFVSLGSIALEKKKLETTKEELDATMNDLLEI